MNNNVLHQQCPHALQCLAACKASDHPFVFLYPEGILCIFVGLVVKEILSNYFFLLFVSYRNRIRNALMLLLNNLAGFLNIAVLKLTLFCCIRHINKHYHLQVAHPQYKHLNIILMLYYLL